MKLRRQLRQCTCGAKHKGFAVGLLLRAAAACTCGSFAPLHQAAFSGELAMLNTLVEKGLDVNAVCKDGDTPLHYAACQGEKECVEALAAAGGGSHDQGQRRRDSVQGGAQERKETHQGSNRQGAG